MKSPAPLKGHFQKPGFVISVAVGGLVVMVIFVLSAMTRPVQSTSLELRSQSYQIIKNAIHTDNIYVRSAAAKAMGDSLDPEVLRWMRLALRDPYPTVRLFAVEAAERFGSETAIQFIKPALEDPDPSVRVTAVRILESIAPDLGRPFLLRAMKDSDPGVQLMGLGIAIRNSGTKSYPNAFETFRHALNHDSAEVRIMAASALGKTFDPNALSLLTQSLKDPDPFVRGYTAQALGDLGGNAALPLLGAALRDPEAYVRSQAVSALSMIGLPEVLAYLQSATGDPDPMVRLSAAIGLFKHRDSHALDLFQKSLVDPDYGIRSAAARAVGTLAESEGLNTAATLAPQVIPLLIPLLEDETTRVRSATARALGGLGVYYPDPTLTALSRRLIEKDPSVKCYIAGAILRILMEPHHTRVALPNNHQGGLPS